MKSSWLPFEQPPAARFLKPLSSAELEQHCKTFVPGRTRINNNWASKVFIEWVASRNANADASMRICPTNLLEKVYPINVLDEWLAAFVLEVRIADGKFYPGTTIKNILSAIH